MNDFSILFNKYFHRLWLFYLILPFIFNPLVFKGNYSFFEEVFYIPKEFYLFFVTIIVALSCFYKIYSSHNLKITAINKTLLFFLLLFFAGIYFSPYNLSALITLTVFFFFLFYSFFFYSGLAFIIHHISLVH